MGRSFPENLKVYVKSLTSSEQRWYGFLMGLNMHTNFTWQLVKKFANEFQRKIAKNIETPKKLLLQYLREKHKP